MKKILRFAVRALLAFVVFVLLYLGIAFVCSRISLGPDQDRRQDVIIYILTNGVHTDVVMPVHDSVFDWSSEVKFENTMHPDSACRYLAVGWGDRGFYLQTPEWKDLKFSVAFRAVTGLSSAAMHTTFYYGLHEDEQCRKVTISKEHYRELVAFIRSSFVTDAGGHFIHIKTNANYGATDAFYEAKGRYNLFYTCNTWANSALRHCGQRHCLWTIFDKGIFLNYENNGKNVLPEH